MVSSGQYTQLLSRFFFNSNYKTGKRGWHKICGERTNGSMGEPGGRHSGAIKGKALRCLVNPPAGASALLAKE